MCSQTIYFILFLSILLYCLFIPTLFSFLSVCTNRDILPANPTLPSVTICISNHPPGLRNDAVVRQILTSPIPSTGFFQNRLCSSPLRVLLSSPLLLSSSAGNNDETQRTDDAQCIPLEVPRLPLAFASITVSFCHFKLPPFSISFFVIPSCDGDFY